MCGLAAPLDENAMQQTITSTNAAGKEAYRRRVDVTLRNASSHEDGSTWAIILLTRFIPRKDLCPTA